jgi:hypothetical protein
VGGKPTVEFSSVNVQVVSGSGSTSATPNGEGNVIVGYAENTKSFSQTGSNDLIVGSDNGWKSYGDIVGGFSDQANGEYATAVGYDDTASGAYSTAAGEVNKATGTGASAIGGAHNTASGHEAAVAGGEYNLASDQLSFIGGGCDSVAGTSTALTGTCPTTGAEAILGGSTNVASGLLSTIAGGQTDLASASNSVAAGGEYNVASDPFSMTSAGCDNVAGTATANTNTCGTGGEAVSGGAKVSYAIKDGTGGLISDVSETSESMNVTDPGGECGNLGIGVANGQVGDTSLFTFPTTGSLPPAALRLTPLGVSTAGFSSFQVCNSSASPITVADPVKVLTFR